jgi:hypothetical protein
LQFDRIVEVPYAARIVWERRPELLFRLFLASDGAIRRKGDGQHVLALETPMPQGAWVPATDSWMQGLLRAAQADRGAGVRVEPVFGQIKEVRGVRRFMRRGLGAGEAEWKLLCGTHNLLKRWRYRAAQSSSAAAS